MTPLLPRSGRLRHLAPACAAILLAAGLSACGGSSKPHTATSSSPGGNVTGPQALVDHLPPITDFRLLHPIEFPNVIDSPEVWTANGGLPGTPGQANANRLTGLGFVAGVRELLGGEQTSSAEVGVEVEQFRTAAAARAELSYRYAQARTTGESPGHTFSRFAVQGVPGAVGYSVNQPGTSSDAVAFAAGSYFYSMQSVVPASSSTSVTVQQMHAAAAAWYHNLKAL